MYLMTITYSIIVTIADNRTELIVIVFKIPNINPIIKNILHYIGGLLI